MLRIVSAALGLLLALGLAQPGHAELAAWDQAKVTALAKQLAENAHALYDTFYKQPPPSVGSGQSQDYRKLKQDVRRIKNEAGELAGALGRGEGRDDTLPIYDQLMMLVRDARQMAARVFTTQDVEQRATAMRQALNEISPYYDPDAVPLKPVGR